MLPRWRDTGAPREPLGLPPLKRRPLKESYGVLKPLPAFGATG